MVKSGKPGAESLRPSRNSRVFTMLLLVVLVLFLAPLLNRPKPAAFEPNVTVGVMPGKSQAALQAELNRAAMEKTFAINYNYYPCFETGVSAGPILFENSAYNAGKLLRLEIYLGQDDTGWCIYRTGLLRPGTFVNEDTLDVALKAGSYPCTAYIYAYRESDESYLGKVAGEMVVTVLH